jgi:hypothetical protein
MKIKGEIMLGWGMGLKKRRFWWKLELQGKLD